LNFNKSVQFVMTREGQFGKSDVAKELCKVFGNAGNIWNGEIMSWFVFCGLCICS